MKPLYILHYTQPVNIDSYAWPYWNTQPMGLFNIFLILDALYVKNGKPIKARRGRNNMAVARQMGCSIHGGVISTASTHPTLSANILTKK
jgi:hypothetical protein